MNFRKPRIFYILVTILLLVLECVIALYINDSFIRPYLGDLIATIVVYGILMSISNLKVQNGILLALLISYTIEFLQSIQIVQLLDLMENKIARTMIGTSFSWMDILMYTLGAIAIYLFERMNIKNRYLA